MIRITFTPSLFSKSLLNVYNFFSFTLTDVLYSKYNQYPKSTSLLKKSKQSKKIAKIEEHVTKNPKSVEDLSKVEKAFVDGSIVE